MGRLIIANMPILPNLTHRFNIVPNKIPASYSVHTDTQILKFIWKSKRLGTVNTILKAGGLTLPNFNIYYKATVIETV